MPAVWRSCSAAERANPAGDSRHAFEALQPLAEIAAGIEAEPRTAERAPLLVDDRAGQRGHRVEQANEFDRLLADEATLATVVRLETERVDELLAEERIDLTSPSMCAM